MIVMAFISLTVVFSFGINAVSADVYVSPTGNDLWDGSSSTWVSGTTGPKLTIKNATATVTSGETVFIQNGTYNENGISVFNKNVNFVGESKNSTIINGGNKSRIFTVGAQGVTYTYSFTNLTFINGNSTSGGAIWNYGSTTITNCAFINNTATYSGGAIINYGTGSAPGSYVVTDSYFSGNRVTSGSGGAIYNGGLGPVSVINSDFTDNTASGTGGVLYNSFGSTSTIQFCRIIGTGNSLIAFQSGSPAVDASLNWWGSNADPNSKVQSGVTVGPWLVLTPQAPTNVGSGSTTSISSDLLHDNGILSDPTNPDLYYHDPIYGHVPDGIPVTFAGDALGSINPLTGTTTNGIVTANFTALDLGISHPTFTVDSQTVSADITILDSTPLTVTTVDPANNAVNMPTNKVIKIKFNKPVQTGNNWIELKNRSGTIIPITTSINNNILTITPVNALNEDKYTIILHTSSLTDLLGSPIALWSSNFSVGTSPTVKTVDPVNNAVNVPANKVIKITFNKSVKAGNNWIELKNRSGVIIPITTSINNNILTITPVNALNEDKYTIILHTGSLTDLAGNPIALWSSNFSVGTSPTVKTVDPANNSANVPTNKVIKITFSESIKAGNNWIELKDSSGKVIPTTISISGTTMTIKPNALLAKGVKYNITLHTGSLTDLAGNPIALWISNFTTA